MSYIHSYSFAPGPVLWTVLNHPKPGLLLAVQSALVQPCLFCPSFTRATRCYVMSINSFWQWRSYDLHHSITQVDLSPSLVSLSLSPQYSQFPVGGTLEQLWCTLIALTLWKRNAEFISSSWERGGERGRVDSVTSKCELWISTMLSVFFFILTQSFKKCYRDACVWTCMHVWVLCECLDVA